MLADLAIGDRLVRKTTMVVGRTPSGKSQFTRWSMTMNDGITAEEVKALLESTASRRKNLEIIREDNWLLKANKWGAIVTVCVIVLMLLALKLWLSLSFAELFATPAVCIAFLLFVGVIWPLASKISRLERKHSALVAFMESEHFFDKETQSQQETPGDK